MQKITVITVSYNAKEHLKKTINNIISFDRKLIELIVIDGGSTDGTLNLLKIYSTKLKYWVSEPDKGIYDAMNKGWRIADPYAVILFLGAGDTLISLPTISDENLITFGKVFIGEKVFKSSVGLKLKFGNTLHHQALLVPKKIHPDPPFDLRFVTYSDFDFNQRLYKAGFKFVYDPSFESFAMPGGISARLDKTQLSKVCYKNYGVFYALISWVYCTYCELTHRFHKLVHQVQKSNG